MNTPGYESLAAVLQRAYDQAAKGKGAERHADHRPFTAQPMQTISELLGTPDGLLYQAMKKIQESKRLDKDAGVRELLGAINYLAGAVIFIESKVRVCSDAADSTTLCAKSLVRDYWVCRCKPDGVLVGIGEACPRCFGIQS